MNGPAVRRLVVALLVVAVLLGGCYPLEDLGRLVFSWMGAPARTLDLFLVGLFVVVVLSDRQCSCRHCRR